MKKLDEEKKLAETVIDIDALSLKKLIIKLDSLERNLRELRKLKGIDIRSNLMEQSAAQRIGTDIDLYSSGHFNNDVKNGRNPFIRVADSVNSVSPRRDRDSLNPSSLGVNNGLKSANKSPIVMKPLNLNAV